ncbi:hypothetical protein F4V57_09540 [Acinetobacter qingfengensis]|uniref:Uncharacterized protein n=1 Tax=Acinetobacter qingfengensis TaxID=1262585 RepID=A0A1E7RFL6_9GAMM|nr:hypothetical protein [Acinetobacter qingfengensis]KAA8732795.1 hypothetical protein F4V57_09540 [Acinetobacter qingfengensis]OEY98093.1 hypothetical protein BJI46_00800 [Acinetobacter qingfengensis]
MQSTKSFKSQLEKYYVNAMMDIIGRGLVVASQVDPEIQQEIQGFPEGLIFSMSVFPHGPEFRAQVTAQHQLILLQSKQQSVDLNIRFKHLHHAFMVFSFQESTAQAFANDRMIADGELSYAIRLVRCLNKMEATILPKALASLAVKAYPQHLNFKEKISLAGNIYFKIAQSYWKRSA